tara:strand:- start:681 stop:911 length:231 start_codon:yes stop_codon:yes gene_type:complete
MCLPAGMVQGGLVGHSIAKANEPDKDPQSVNNVTSNIYYGQPETEQEDPIVEANVEANKTSLKAPTKQTSKTNKAY